MEDFAVPGTWGSLTLRLFQCIFAACSITAMETSANYYYYTALCCLVISMSLQGICGFLLALLDAYLLFRNDTLYDSFPVYAIAVSDWPLDPQDLPQICRDEIIEYTSEVKKLGTILFELLSERLGLKKEHLKGMECEKGLAFLGHYYPGCPKPELTMGSTKHSDPDFHTVLLQDQVGGLQIFHQSCWIDVPPVVGALVINIGDLLQLISNDKFKTVEHRVLANKIGPRVLVACFFTPHLYPSTRKYGPIEELITEYRPPVYRETTVKDFVTYYD